MNDSDHTLATQETGSEMLGGREARRAMPCLTVLCHPEIERIGERAVLHGLAHAGGGVELARLTPAFQPVGGDAARPLDDSRLSRRPILVSRTATGALRLDASSTKIRLRVDGAAVESACDVSPADLERGVVLQLGSRIALCLHLLEPAVVSPPAFGLVGESSSIWRLRREIEQIADLDMPVLLRGESGTGKELVARAIRGASRRKEEAYLALNMAAIPANLAASELFGAAKGAFSGADKRRPGYFERADGGTLFLDEIGEMPVEVQALMLRALESGEIQPVGSEVPQKVDVRVIAATDADLELAIEEGRFRAPLLHRLASFEIELPPLRERREDVGRLFFHFLREEWRDLAAQDRTRGGDAPPPKVDADIVARLAAFDWPGNVRQLRNVVRQLVVTNRGLKHLEIGSRVAKLLAVDDSAPVPPIAPVVEGATTDEVDTAEVEPSEWDAAESEAESTSTPSRTTEFRDRSEVGEEELIEALHAHQYRIQPTARALRISRTALYALIDACPRIRKASDLDAEEIRAAAEEYGGKLPDAAAQLGVSLQGLKMRIRELDLRF